MGDSSGRYDAAERHLALGKEHNGRGEWTQALAELERCIALVSTSDDPAAHEIRARALVTRALTDLQAHGRARSRRTLTQAREIGRRIDSPYALALADVQEGTILMHLGEWQEGLDVLRRVTHEDLRLPLEQLAVLLNRGLAHITLLDLARGKRDLDAALELAERHGWPEMRFKALHNLGCLEYFAGNLPGAISLMQQADELPVRVDRVRAHHDLGRVMLEAGLVEQASARLMEAARQAREGGQALEEGEIHLDLMRAHLVSGDLQRARVSVDAAHAAFAEVGDDSRAAHATLLHHVLDPARGFSPSPESIENGHLGRLARLLLAQSQLDQGDLTGARSSLSALPTPARDGLSAEMHERFLRARLAAEEGDAPAVGRAIAAARRRLESQRSRNPSVELRAGLSLHAHSLADLDLRRALRSGRPGTVFDAVARWRGASTRVVGVRPDHDPEVAGLVTQLRLLRHSAVTETDPDHSRAIAARIPRIERRLEARIWAQGSARSDATMRASYSQVRALLRERGQTLLVYVSQDDTTYCLVVGGRRSHLRALPRGPVLELAEQLRRDLRARAMADGTRLEPMLRRAVENSVRSLHDLLVAPVRDLLEHDVVIAPTRGLISVPWALVPDLTDRAITVAPSIHRWAHARSRTVTDVATIAGPGVARAAAEVTEIAATWSRSTDGAVRVSARTAAHARDLAEAFESADLVHVAAHGRHEDQSPMFSSVWLADGPLFAHELGQVRTHHAVLSACDVGRSRVRPGHEPLGLTMALVTVGVQSVLAPVCPIREDLAAEAMVRYHRGLAQGLSAARALVGVREQIPDMGALTLYGADW